MSEHITELSQIQISERALATRAQDIKKEVEESLLLPFDVRINHPKWQVRKRLYQQIYQNLQTSSPLSDLDHSFKQPETFCIWIKNLLDQPHPSSLNEAIKIIQLFTSRYSLGVKEINCFLGFLIEKSSATNISITKFQTILENCMRDQQIATGLILELARYAQNKNNKIALLSVKGLKMVTDKFQLTEKKYIDLLFELNTRILESSVQKELRTVSLQMMGQLIKYSKQPFEVLAETKFKKIRPIVLKQLKAIIGSNPISTTLDATKLEEDVQYQEVDLKAIAPPKFFYLDTVANFNQKKSILVQFQQKLQKSLGCPAVKKDYFQIYNVIENLLQESNQIVASIGLRILKLVLRIHGQFIPESNFKRFFILTGDKYKGPKSQSLNQQIHSLVSLFFSSKQHQLQYLVDVSFQIIQKSKNQNAKTGILDWWSSQYPKLFQSKPDQKLKHLNTYLKKKVEQTRKTKNYLMIKTQIENLNLALNNMETMENRSNLHRMIKTQPAENPNTKKEKSKSKESSILSFTQAMKISGLPKQQKSRCKKSQQISTVQANQSYFTSYQSPSRQPSLLERVQLAFQGIKKSIVSNNHNSTEIYFSDLNDLISKCSGQFFQILNIVMTFVDQLLFTDLKKSKMSQLKQMEFVFEQISKLVIKLNKQTSSLDEQCIRLELQLILTKIELNNMKILQTLLDSLYMCSTIQMLLKATLNVYRSCQYFYLPIKEFYTSWLSTKIQLVNVSPSQLLPLAYQFEKANAKISRTILKKCNKLSSDKEEEQREPNCEKVSFMTPKKQFGRSGSQEVQRSRTLSLQTSRQSNTYLSQDVAIVQELLVKDYPAGIMAFDELLDKEELLESKRRSSRKANKVQRVDNQKEYHKIIKCICKHIEPRYWNEATRILLKYRLQYPSQQIHLLQMFLVFSCTKLQFKEPKQHHLLLNFLEILLDSMDSTLILSKYKSSFEYIYFKFPNFHTETFMMLTLPFLISRILHNELSLNECQYLINPLCFCLLYPTTYDIANNYLDKIHRGRKATRGKIQQLLRLKIKDELLRNAYEEWLNKYAIEEMEIGTISEVPQLVDDISNCKSLVDGLQQFANKSVSSNSLRFTSPIVGLSKVRDLDSEKRGEIMREPSKSSTIERPISILKNFHSSKEILQQSLEHHTEIHHFQQINELKTINQIKEIDTYQYQKHQLRTLLPQQVSNQVSDSIRQLRQLFLTSESNPEQIIQNLWQMYTSLQSDQKEERFIRDLKTSILNPNFILSLSQVNYYVLLSFILKLCSNIPAQKHQSQSSYYLRQLLNLLLTYKNSNSVLIICIRILNHHLCEDFEQPLTFQEKLMFRLITNCIERLPTLIQSQEMRSFQVLLEIYKFFKVHPPETLVKGIPSLKQIEGVFNTLKKITNIFIEGNRERSREFLKFIKRKSMNSIYLTYVAAVIDRK